MTTRGVGLAAAAAVAILVAIGLGTGRPALIGASRAPARKAPEFVGIERWLNSEPLSLESLRGKVVLVEFWTFACANCLHLLPHVSGWHDAYKERGLVVIGVHTPETSFEQLDEQLERALARHRITFPVAQDNAYATWKAWDNHYWPAIYLVDRRGNVAFSHFGEGDTEEVDAAIRRLLDEPA